MSKKKTSLEKSILQQRKSNIIRDRKGRPFYINPSDKQAYRVKAEDEKFLYIYDARILFSLIPSMLIEMLARKYIIFGVIASIIIFIGFEVYYRFFILKNLNKSNNPPQEVFDIYNSDEVIRSKKSDALMKLFLGIAVSFMVMSNINAFDIFSGFHLGKYIKAFITIIMGAIALSPVNDFF
ncbi:MAG: hypothetical protein GX038_03440, partial [Erysipelothrix sp.]|nr:hypothetical protein [Erysipelothrix sp.]